MHAFSSSTTNNPLRIPREALGLLAVTSFLPDLTGLSSE